VQLVKFWVTNTVTQEQISAYSMPDRKRGSSVTGEVRRYAGGRMRAVGIQGKSSTWAVSLAELSLSQVETLELWMTQGITILARDNHGVGMYGTFFGVDIDEMRAINYSTSVYTASIDIQRVDVVEGV
jgi:hypothetical protein